MRVLLGNPKSASVQEPTITYSDLADTRLEDGTYSNGYIVGSDAAEIKDHLFDNQGPVTHLPGNGAVLNVVRSWSDHPETSGKPTWVVVEPGDREPEHAEDFERFLSEFWHIPRGYPADLEATHHTFNGPPGVGE